MLTPQQIEAIRQFGCLFICEGKSEPQGWYDVWSITLSHLESKYTITQLRDDGDNEYFSIRGIEWQIEIEWQSPLRKKMTRFDGKTHLVILEHNQLPGYPEVSIFVNKQKNYSASIAYGLWLLLYGKLKSQPRLTGDIEAFERDMIMFKLGDRVCDLSGL